MAAGDLIPVSDQSLVQFFSWAGSRFPYNGGAADITISGATTWSDAAGYKQVGKLTINAGQTLTISQFPFVIFANEINFGDTNSTIEASGTSGGVSVTFGTGYCRGGLAVDGSSRAQGGCGGGFLIIVTNKFTGANGKINANGGNGYCNVTSAGTNAFQGGQGALSSHLASSAAGDIFNFGIWGGSLPSVNVTDSGRDSTMDVLGKGGQGSGSDGGVGGGSGSSNSKAYGGSGIGGGGSSTAGGTSGAGQLPFVTPRIDTLLQLFRMQCMGGGGGGAQTNTTGANNSAGGGGGGAILLFSKAYTATPTLSVTGGSAAGSGTNVAGVGAVGITYSVTL